MIPLKTARDNARDNIKTETLASIYTESSDRKSSQPVGAPESSEGPHLYDPLKPENLRIDQSELDQPVVKPELTAIPVKRPEKFEFIRVHPHPEYRCGPVSFITIGRSEFYIVPPAFRKNLKPREYWIGQIFLAVNRLEKPFLWMVKLQSPSGRVSDWYTSEMECAERAMRDWVQVISDQDAGQYAIVPAEDQLEEPVWPTQSFAELLKLGFKRRTVDTLDHAVFKHLRGKI